MIKKLPQISTDMNGHRLDSKHMGAAEFRNELLIRLNEWELPIMMSAGEVKRAINNIYDDFIEDNYGEKNANTGGK